MIRRDLLGAGRGPVVFLDRTLKAKMIEAFLEEALGQKIKNKQILDIGSGNGDISEYFSKENIQYSVDVQDKRREENESATFSLVKSEILPFSNNSFDIVISSHVIEHVDNQGLHLDEMHRVLKPDGIAYLGTPNKSSPIMEGHIDNDKVLRYNQMESLFEIHNFNAELLSIRLMKEPDKYHCEIKFGRFIPAGLLNWLKMFFPSQSFLLRPKVIKDSK